MNAKALTEGPILNNGVKMPWLGLGVFKTQEGDEVINAVKDAVAAGYRSIDTASVYKNEQGVGQAVRECGIPREELFITTKVWNNDQGYDQTLKAFEESRKRLGLEYIDLYLVHWAVLDKYRETWKALIHLYQEGVVKAIGVSNHQIPHLKQIIEDTGVVPAVNQVECHPLLTQKELLTFCKQQGIQLEAWSPLIRGNLDNQVLLNLAAKYGKTPAQIVLRWDIQNQIVTIPKSVHKERIIENSLIFDFELSPDDMQEIDSLNENKRLGPDPDNVNF
ncbi:MAG: aldo/keto reductase [Syntrophomonadaceae bacterium]|jgi:diketogulonate reductase-like aldo/keto reductase|nr:aldo/keto reductase [Syntrophomonadaceae bacterium]